MPLRSPAELEIYGKSLADILAHHEEWISSGFRAGERAVLESADLREVNLAGLDLRQADFTNADLRRADLGRSKLNGATLCGALLRDAVLNGVDFTHDSDTVRASTPVLGPAPTELQEADIGGADMTVALLPREAPLHADLREAARVGRGALRIGSMLIILLAITVVGILITRDADLLRDAPLPLLFLPLTILYWLAPVALLLIYVWWHFSYLGRLWRIAARLPAYLPEGAPLSAHAPLRPFSYWLAGRMPLLVESSESRWDKLRAGATGFVVWWLTPLVIAAIWWRYLVLHEPIGSFVHIAVTAAAVAIAGSWKSTALRGFRPHHETTRRPRPVLAAGGAALALACFSLLAIERELPAPLARSLDIRFEDFSTSEPLSLRERNLRFATLDYCMLPESDLSGARLERASFAVSDLTGADLRDADLSRTSLFSTRLHNATLEGANLSGANLRCAVGLTERQLAAATTDESTVFPDGSQGPLVPGVFVTRIDPLDCTHWRPDGTQVPVETIQRLQRLREALPDINLDPIPDLPPSTTTDGTEEEPATASPDAQKSEAETLTP